MKILSAKEIFQQLLIIQKKNLTKKLKQKETEIYLNQLLKKNFDYKTTNLLLKKLGLPSQIKDLNSSIIKANLDVLEGELDSAKFVSLHDKKVDSQNSVNIGTEKFSYVTNIFIAIDNNYFNGGHPAVLVGVDKDKDTGEVIYQFCSATTKNNFLEQFISGVVIVNLIKQNIENDMRKNHFPIISKIKNHNKFLQYKPIVRGPQTWMYGALGDTPLLHTNFYDKFVVGVIIGLTKQELDQVMKLDHSGKVTHVEAHEFTKVILQNCQLNPDKFWNIFWPIKGTYTVVTSQDLEKSNKVLIKQEYHYNKTISEIFNTVDNKNNLNSYSQNWVNEVSNTSKE